MLISALSSLALLLAATPASLATLPVAPERPVHLGLTLRLTHVDEMNALRAAQQDPSSPSFRQWLTPQEFGARFGQPTAVVNRTRRWLEAAGFKVTVYPNNSFFEVIGTVKQAEALLHVTLKGYAGQPVSVHTPDRAPTFPEWLSSQVVHVSGLDTRGRFHRRTWDSYGDEVFGPQDLRALYDANGLLGAGFYGQGQQLVYIGPAEAPGSQESVPGIDWFLSNVADSSATFVENVLANPDADYDSSGGGGEDDLDAEMQSVGSPGATTITYEVVPYSQLIVLGAQDVASNMPTATAVSISWGLCESEEVQNVVPGYGYGEPTATRQAVIQGTMEGQTWFAAAGDSGSDDCGDGSGPAVDFPASIPEVVAVGGTGVYDALNFDSNFAVTSYEQEDVWNDGEQFGFGFGGAGGGGLSIIYTATDGGIPGYQSGLGLAGRGVPDLALMAGNPYIVSIDMPGVLGSGAGTSYASPLSAGFIGLIASRVGCRLGDIHAALYTLGGAQQDGGSVVFNDVTYGDNGADGVFGWDAGPGWDLASGWGSMDVGQLANALPACDGGPKGDAGPAYSQCGFIGCSSGCDTVPEGPSSCNVLACTADGGYGGCVSGTLCTSGGPFADNGDAGVCIPGCLTNADCPYSDAGYCDLCLNACVPVGNVDAQIGGPCTTTDDCGSGMICLIDDGLFADAGYCSQVCDPSGQVAVCGCPGTTYCDYFASLPTCMATCGVGGTCPQPGQVCQSNPGPAYPGSTPGPALCLPDCIIWPDAGINGGPLDSCLYLVGQGSACNLDSGVCSVPPCQILVGQGMGGGDYDTCANLVGYGSCDVDSGMCLDAGVAGTTTTATTGTGTSGATTGTTSTGTATSGTGTGTATSGVAASSTGTGSTGNLSSASSTGGSTGTGSTGGSSGSSSGAGSSTGTNTGSTSGSASTGTTGHASTSTGATTTGGVAASTSTGAAATTGASSTTGTSTGSSGNGCGCSPTGQSNPDLLAGLAFLALVVYRRRR